LNMTLEATLLVFFMLASRSAIVEDQYNQQFAVFSHYVRVIIPMQHWSNIQSSLLYSWFS
jgi:hypothetical protein